jgi:hypothetical protein
LLKKVALVYYFVESLKLSTILTVNTFYCIVLFVWFNVFFEVVWVFGIAFLRIPEDLQGSQGMGV